MADLFESQVYLENEHYLEQISLEAMSNPFKGITASLKSNMHRVLANIPLVRNSNAGENDLAKKLSEFNNNKSDPTLKNVNHLETKDILVVVPVGFTGDYIGYTKVLTDQFRIMQDLNTDVIIPAHNLILKYIGKPSSMAAIDNVDLQRIKLHSDEIEEFKKQMNSFFDAKRKHQSLPIGKLVNSAKEFNEFATELSGSILPWMLNDKWRNDVFKSYTALQESLDLLMVRIEQKPDEYHFNKLNAERLSKLVNDVAVEIELTGAMFTYVNQLLECAVHLQTTLITAAD